MKQLICCQNCTHDTEPAHIRPCAECYRDGTLRKFEASKPESNEKKKIACSC